MDPYRLLVVLHVLGAVTWVGGVLFMGLVAVPVARRLAPDLRHRITVDVGRQARTVGWIALAVVLATGIAMANAWGADWATVFDGSFFAYTPRNRLLGWKLLLVAAMLVVTGFHDWVLGPRHAHAPGDERARKLASRLGRVTGLLVIAIVVLAVYVARAWS
jgi:uncharacterized membrane protein